MHSAINEINEITSLDKQFLENGDLFLFLSIDQYIAPQRMHVAGSVKVTGVLYSKPLDMFIWKDTLEGNYANTGIAYGPGAYVGMLTLKVLSSDCLLRNNAFSAIKVLLTSLPSFPRKR